MPLTGSEALYRDALLNFKDRPAPYFFYDFTENQGASVPNLGSTAGATLNLGTAGAGWTSEGGTTFWQGGSDGAVTGALSQSLSGHGFTFFVRWRLDVPHNNYGVSFNLGAWDSFQYHQGSGNTAYIGHDASSRFVSFSGPAQQWMTVVFRSMSTNYGFWRNGAKLLVHRNGSDPFPDYGTAEIYTDVGQNIHGPDIDASKFEIADTNGSNQFSVQHIGVWPFEMTDAEVEILLTKPTVPVPEAQVFFVDFELNGVPSLAVPTIYYDQSQIAIGDDPADELLLSEGIAEVPTVQGTVPQQTSWNLFVDPGKTQEEDSAYLANLPTSFDAEFTGTLTLDDYNMTLSAYKSEVLATSPNVYFQFGDGLQNLGSDVGDSLELLGNAAIVPAVDEDQWTFIDALEDLQLRQNTFGYSDGDMNVVKASERYFNSDRQPTNTGNLGDLSGAGNWMFAYSISQIGRYIVFPSAKGPTSQFYCYESTSYGPANSLGNQHVARYPSIGTAYWNSASTIEPGSTSFTTYDRHWTEFAALDAERKQRVIDFCNGHESPVPAIVVTQEDLDKGLSFGELPPNIKSFDAVYFLCKNTNSKFPQDYRLICMYRTGSVGLRDNKVLSMKGYASASNSVVTGLSFDRREGGVSPASINSYTQIFTYRNSLNPVPTKTQTGNNAVSPTWRPMKHWFHDLVAQTSSQNYSMRGLRSTLHLTGAWRHEIHPQYRLFNSYALDQLFGADYKYDYYENMTTGLSTQDYFRRFGEGVMTQGNLPTTTDEWITIGVVWEDNCPEKPGYPRFTYYVNGVRLPYMYGSTDTNTLYKTFPEFALSIDGKTNNSVLWHEHEYASAMSWDRALTDAEMRRLTGAPKTYVVEPSVSVISIPLSSEINIDHTTDATPSLQDWFVVDYQDAYQGIVDMAPDLYWNFSPGDVNQNVLTDASGKGRTGEFGRAFLANYQGNVWWRVPTTLEEKPDTTVTNNPVVEPIVSLYNTSTFTYYLPTVVELDDGTVVDMRASLNAHWQFILNSSSYRTRYSPLYFMVEDTEEIFTVNTGSQYIYNYAIGVYSNLNYWNSLWGNAGEDVRAKFAPYAGKRVTLIGTGYTQLSYKEFYAARQSPTAPLTPGAVGFTRENYKSFISTTNPVIYWEFDTEGSTITNLGSAGSAGDATVTGGTWERNGWRRSPGDSVQSSYVWPTGGVENPITIMIEYEVVPDGATYSGVGPHLDFGTNTGGWKFEQYGAYSSRFRGTNSSSNYYAYGSFVRSSNSGSTGVVTDDDLPGQDTRRRRMIMRSQATYDGNTSSAFQNVSYSSIVPGETAEEIPGQTDRWSQDDYYETGGYGPGGVVNERIAIGLLDTINVDYVVRRVAIWDRKLNDQEVGYLHGGPPGSLPAGWRTVEYSEPSNRVSTSPPNVQAVNLKGQNAAISGSWNESIDVDHTFYVAFRNKNGYASTANYSNGTSPFDFRLTGSIIKFGFASNGWSRIEIDASGNLIDPYYGSNDYTNDGYLPQVVPDHFGFFMYVSGSVAQPAFYSAYNSSTLHSTIPPEIDSTTPVAEWREWNRLVIQTRHNEEGGLEWRWQMNARPFADQQWSAWDLIASNTNAGYYRALPFTKFGGQNSKPTHFYIEPPDIQYYDQETEVGAVAVWRRQLTDEEAAELIFQNIGDSPLVGSVQMDIELPNADIIAIGGAEIVLESTVTLDVVPTGTVTLPTGVAAESTVDWFEFEIPAVDPTVVQVLALESSIEVEHQLSAEPFLITIVQIDGSIEHDQVFEGSPWLVPILYKEAVSDAVYFTLGPSTLDLIGLVQIFGSSNLGDVTFEANPTLTEILFISTSADIVDYEIPLVVETRPHMQQDFLAYILDLTSTVALPEPLLQATPTLTGKFFIDSTVDMDISLGSTPTLINKLFIFNQFYVDLTLQATPTLTTILNISGSIDADFTLDESLWLVDILEIDGEVNGDFYFLGSWTVPIVSEYLSAEVNADIELSVSYVRWQIGAQVALVDMEIENPTMDVYVVPPITEESYRPPLQFPPGSEGSQGTFGRLPNVTSGARKATGGSHSELPPKSC